MLDKTVIMRAVASLCEPETRRLQNVIDKLVAQNQEIVQTNDQGFMFQGDLYYRSNANMHSRLPALAWSLCPQMDVHLKDRRLFDQEFAMIRQMVTRLLYLCNTLQKQRDALPDCIVNLVPELQAIERVRSVEEVIGNDERLLRQYHKALPLMEVYSVSRMFF
ncbi:hypothetical protein Fifi067_00045 [Erwinia phage Fifi067]|nr:hypothetical protein Fifi067_00045 [Erwinia phage Fifi067]WBQ32509.1 hypothetical protein [Erwinia phage Kuerle]